MIKKYIVLCHKSTKMRDIMLRERLKRFALKHHALLSVYRNTFGKIKTEFYFGRQKKALQKDGYRLLVDIHEALEKHNVKFIVEAGTLLGMVREGRLLLHDKDMDFGIFFDKDFTPEKLDAVMKKIGLKKHYQFVFRGDTAEITYGKGILHVDFFRIYQATDSFYTYTFYRNAEKDYPDNAAYSVMKVVKAPFEKIVSFDAGGLRVNVPENYEEYLASSYTEGWRTPDPHWSYFMMPGASSIPWEYARKES